MTAKEFEDLVTTTKVTLSDAFKHGTASDLEICTKVILDYQEIIAKAIFNEFKNTQDMIVNLRGDILKDNRERFEKIMIELDKNRNK